MKLLCVTSLAVALAVATSCGHDEEFRCPPGASCTACASSWDCPGWETCGEAGACVPAQPCDSSADCGGDDICGPNSWCQPEMSFDPAGVALLGVVIPMQSSGRSLARVEAPTRMFTALSYWADPKMGPDGSIFYRWSNPARDLAFELRRFVPDPFVWDSSMDRWSAVPDTQNDPVVPTPACQPATWLVTARGGVVYTCMGGPPLEWFDGEGNLVLSGYHLLGWNAADIKLVHRGGGDPYLYLLDGENRPSLPVERALRVFVKAVRSRGAGFRVLNYTTSEGSILWSIHPGVFPGQVVVRQEATYGPQLAEAMGGSPPVIDRSGAAWSFFWGLRGYFIVFRCPPNEPCEPVYDSSIWDVPRAPDERGEPPQHFVSVDGPFSALLSGP